jgi:hypothetical protein
MHVSMPHCCDEVHVLPPAGTSRQLPERQNWPELHCALLVHEGWQRPLVHTSENLQSDASSQRGSTVHVPPMQPQLE